MPVRKKKKSAPETSKALVIFLVFFILLAIVEGVVAYYGYADKEKDDQARKAALDKAEKMEGQRNGWRYISRKMVSLSGELPAEEQKELDKQEEAWHVTKDLGKDIPEREVYAKIIEKIEGELGYIVTKDRKLFDKEKNPNAGPYKEIAARLQGILAERDKTIKTKTTDEQTAKDKQGKAEADYDTEKKANEVVQGKTAKKAKDDFDDFTKNTIAKYEAQIRELNDQLTKAKATQAEAEAKVVVQEKEVKEQEKKTEAAKRIVVAKVDLLQNDQPKGEIYSIERSGAVVYVKLTSTRNLPPQQTFSIRGVGQNGTVLPEIKGKLMITEVLTDQLCQARVTEAPNRDYDPILRGDQLYTIGWNPAVVQHVAILGLVDLSSQRGDVVAQGLQNPAEAMKRVNDFADSLRRQGMVVDAIFDLQKNKLVDPRTQKEMTEFDIQTDYLIVGDWVENNARAPEMPAGGGGKEEGQGSVFNKIMKDAVSKGITVVALRKFLAMSGYRSLPVGAPEGGYDPHRVVEQAASPLDRNRERPRLGAELPQVGMPK